MKLIIPVVAFVCLATASVAEKTSIPSQSSPTGCLIPERPLYPSGDSVGRHRKNRIAEAVYNSQRADRILSDGVCTCSTVFPAWETAITEFEEKFSKLPSSRKTDDDLDQFFRDVSEKWQTARKFCRSKGVF